MSSDVEVGGSDRGMEIAWAAFAAANLALMVRYPTWATVPFHLIWVSFAVLYGIRAWGPVWTMVAVGIIAVVTGALITMEGLREEIFPERAVEVPLMAALFVAMVWHVHRHLALTERLREVSAANAKLLERERRFGQAASHELRTPITIALGHAELLARTTTDVGDRSDVGIVIEELHRLRGLTDELLHLERTVERARRHPEVVRIGALLERAVERWDFADRRWSVEAGEDVVVRADAQALGQVVDALIDNAVKHTSPSDAIILSAASTASGTSVRVEDTGEGIAPDDLDAVFDRFHRGTGESPDRSSAHSGFGLGLALVREVVEAHGGTTIATSSDGQTAIAMTFPSLSVVQPSDAASRYTTTGQGA